MIRAVVRMLAKRFIAERARRRVGYPPWGDPTDWT